MGLPCPNIFAGEHAFHSRLEWVSRQDMEKAVRDHRASGDDLGGEGVTEPKLKIAKTTPCKAGWGMEHDPDKCEAVFGKDHALTS